jgi:hypothetical protein
MRRTRAATVAFSVCLAVAIGGLTAAAQPSPFLAEPALVRYEDPAGDVAGGDGPDIIAVTVSQPDPASVNISVEFATVPPLGYDLVARWTDVLGIEIGTGPDGVSATLEGYPVGDRTTGVHGVTLERTVDDGAILLRDDEMLEGAVTVAVDGPTVTLTLTRESLGDPDRMTFVVLAGREVEDGQPGGEDFFPDHPDIGPFAQAAWTFPGE